MALSLLIPDAIRSPTCEKILATIVIAPKLIRLSVYRQEESIEIEVMDNGAGMSRERIEEVMSGKRGSQEVDSNGVGLSNVISRLKLFYGTERVLDIYSEGKDKGCIVRIHIPVNKEEYNV